MVNYAQRDQEATVGLYALLWRNNNIDVESFDTYWSTVHSPLCSRQPGLYQYWQIGTNCNYNTVWNTFERITTVSQPEENFDGIAEFMFQSSQDISVYIKSALKYLGQDDPNFIRKAIVYLSTPITYYDAIENPAPTLETGYDKFHIMIRKIDGVSLQQFQTWIKFQFAPQLAKSASVQKLRVHLLQAINHNPDRNSTVSYTQDSALNIEIALEIGFKNRLDLRTFINSDDYKTLTQEMTKYVKSFQAYPQRNRMTFVYDSQPTLAGQRGFASALAIEKVGAINQTRQNIQDLMLGKH